MELVGDHVSECTSHPFADCGCRRGSSFLSLLPSLFSLLSSLYPCSRQRFHHRAAWPRKKSAPLWRPHLRTFGGLFWGLSSLLSSLFALLPPLFSLLSSPCRRDLASLFSLLSSLFSRCCSFLRSFFAPATSNFASSHRIPNCLDPLRHPPWPGGMREAMK